MNRAKARNDLQAVRRLQQERRTCPSQDTHDPNYHRLSYVRYADDFLLGYIGPKAEAEAIKEAIGAFLHDRLHLSMSEEKTPHYPCTHRTGAFSQLCDQYLPY